MKLERISNLDPTGLPLFTVTSQGRFRINAYAVRDLNLSADDRISFFRETRTGAIYALFGDREDAALRESSTSCALEGSDANSIERLWGQQQPRLLIEGPTIYEGRAYYELTELPPQRKAA